MCGPDVQIWSGVSYDPSVYTGANFEADDVCFVGGRVTPKVLTTDGALGFTQVVSVGRPRRRLAGWFLGLSTVCHTQVGGITEQVLMMVLHSKTLELQPYDIGTTIPRDASTVQNQACFAQLFRGAPSEVFVRPLRCHLLSGDEHPVYHGFGWLPASDSLESINSNFDSSFELFNSWRQVGFGVCAL